MESRLVKMYPESQAATTPVSLVVVFSLRVRVGRHNNRAKRDCCEGNRLDEPDARTRRIVG